MRATRGAALWPPPLAAAASCALGSGSVDLLDLRLGRVGEDATRGTRAVPARIVDERTTHVEEDHEEPGEAQPQEGMGKSPTTPQRKGAPATAAAGAAAAAAAAPAAAAAAAAAEEEEEEAEAEEAEEDRWADIEVGSEELAEDHLPFAALLGSDVCVLPPAFPGFQLQMQDSIGWRGARGDGQAPQGRGHRRTIVQVQVFGAWFDLNDARRICPIEQAVRVRVRVRVSNPNPSPNR